MVRIKFTTDSAADIPAHLREELGVQVMPFPIVMGDRELEDGVGVAPEEFYDLLLAAPQLPTHAALNMFQFNQVFEQAWGEGYTDLIHVSINAKGSATYQNAIQAREEFYEEHPEAKGTFAIHIIDSRSYTMSYGWPVLEGARMAAQGKETEEIVSFIQDWVDHARVIFVPLDLRFAKKSGRVSAAAAFMGEALGLKPVMTFEDGQSRILAKVRGEKNVISTLVNLCNEERRPGTPYLLIRGNNEEQAEKLAEACCCDLGEEPALTYFVGGVVSINAGPNLVGLCYRT